MDKSKVESYKVVRVMFGIPNEGHTEPEAYDNRMVMNHHLGALQVLSSLGIREFDGVEFDYPDSTKFEFFICSIGQVFPALARERIAEYAVERGMDYLFMVDDDMITEPDLFERLYKHDVDICAALAFTRYAPHKPVIYELDEGYDEVERKHFYRNYSLMSYPKDTLVECDAVGFGAVLIKVDLLRAMKKPWFMTTSGAGEDIHFCHSAKKAGYRVFMDTATKLGHIGVPPIITEETYEAQKEAQVVRENHGETSKYAKTG